MDHHQHTLSTPARRLVDYYRFLGIPSNATTDRIVEAYLIKAEDPDLRVQERAEQALAALSDPTTRQAYDQALSANGHPPSRQPAGRNRAPVAGTRQGAAPPARARATNGRDAGRPAGSRVHAGGRVPYTPAPPVPLTWIGGVVVTAVVLALSWWGLTHSSNVASGVPAGASARTLGMLRSASSTGALQLGLTAAPDPPRPGPTTFTLQVQDLGGNLVSAAQVTWSLDMTNMAMGRQTGQMTELGAGQYQASANFSMGGPWRINVAVGKAGAALGSGSFDLQIR